MKSNIWRDDHHCYFSSNKALHLPLLLLKQDPLLYSQSEYRKRSSRDCVYRIFPQKFECSFKIGWKGKTTVNFCLATHLNLVFEWKSKITNKTNRQINTLIKTNTFKQVQHIMSLARILIQALCGAEVIAMRSQNELDTSRDQVNGPNGGSEVRCGVRWILWLTKPWSGVCCEGTIVQMKNSDLLVYS